MLTDRTPINGFGVAGATLLAIFAAAGRGLGPASPLAIGALILALPAWLAFVYRRPLPDWPRRPRLLRLALVPLPVGPLAGLLSYVPVLSLATRKNIAFNGVSAMTMLGFVIWYGFGVRRATARSFLGFDTRPQGVRLRPSLRFGAVHDQPPPESGRSSRSWRRTVRASITVKQSWLAFERWRIAHQLRGGEPLIPIEDTEAVTAWDGAAWGIARWRVPVADQDSATPLTLLVIRPIPHGVQPTAADHAARIALFAARHLILALAPFALLIAAGLVDPALQLELFAADALLAVLYTAVIVVSSDATRLRRGPQLPLDAQTALRRMRNRGYHPTFHRELWDAISPPAPAPRAATDQDAHGEA